MRYGNWTPLPHAVRGDDAMAETVYASSEDCGVS